MLGTRNFSIKRRRNPDDPVFPANKRAKTIPQPPVPVRERPRRRLTGGCTTDPVLNVKKLEEKGPLKPKEENIPKEKEEDLNSTGEEVSSYEQMRLNNLQDNADFLAQLGIAEAKDIVRQSSRSNSTQLKPKPVKKEKVRAPPEPRRVSLRLAKMDPDGAPLPEDYKSVAPPPVDEHPRKPSGPLEMKEYLGFNSEESEHTVLMDKMRTCFKCKTERSKSTSDSLDSFVKTLSKLTLDGNNVAKIVPQRIFSIDIHPTSTKLITAAGDKWGFLGIWDVQPDRTHQSDGVVVYTPHSRPINCLRFSLYKPHQLYSCSYDGTFRYGDLEKEVFNEIYAMEDYEGNLLKNFDFLSADTMLVSQQDGYVALTDTRTPGCNAEQEYLLHAKSLRTVSIHPVKKDIFCTSSTDGFVSIWDLRKLKSKGKCQSISDLPHGKNISSAYFSPVTGNYILSTSMDDRISIFNCENLSSVKKEHSIVHDNHTGRWLTNFRASWHPTREDVFTVGSMSRPRQIDIIGSNGKRLVTLRDSEQLGSVCSLTMFSRSHDVVIGANSSGRLHVFK